MPEVATELELYTGEGPDLQPGSDLGNFADAMVARDTILLTHPLRARYIGLGVYIGQLVNQQTSGVHDDIRNAITERFVREIDISLRLTDREGEELILVRDGISVSRKIEETLRSQEA